MTVLDEESQRPSLLLSPVFNLCGDPIQPKLIHRKTIFFAILVVAVTRIAKKMARWQLRATRF